jgi:hypothetical protein
VVVAFCRRRASTAKKQAVPLRVSKPDLARGWPCPRTRASASVGARQRYCRPATHLEFRGLASSLSAPRTPLPPTSRELIAAPRTGGGAPARYAHRPPSPSVTSTTTRRGDRPPSVVLPPRGKCGSAASVRRGGVPVAPPHRTRARPPPSFSNVRRATGSCRSPPRCLSVRRASTAFNAPAPDTVGVYAPPPLDLRLNPIVQSARRARGRWCRPTPTLGALSPAASCYRLA